MTKLRTWALERGGLVAMTTLILYIALAPHHVVDGDNSEFATLSVTGGAAHPSGYPLYVLWLRAMSWLPGTSPAHTAAIATAILGAATVLVLHAACRAWGARPLAATLAVALFASGPVVLRVVTEAEVFALNNLAVASVLWLAADRGPARGRMRAVLLGLVAGLGLSNNLTCSLVAPVGLLGIIRAARELHAGSRSLVRASGESALLAVFGLVLGLVPYTYLLLAPDTPLSWGAPRSVGRVVAMIMREDYGGLTSFRLATVEVSPADNLLALARTIGRGWFYVPAVAGLAVLVTRCLRTHPSAEPRAGWISLGVAWLVAGPLLVLRFNVPPEGLGLYVNQRFHLMPLLLLAPAVALAAELAFERITIPRAALVGALVSTIGLVGLISTSLSYVGRVHSPAVETSAKNMLLSLPPDSVVIHSQDELHAVTGYVQWALGQRQDVRIVTWSLMTLPWYRERVAARGIRSGQGTGSPEQRLVASLISRGAPVFVDRLQRDIIGAFATYPYGVLMRVVPQGQQTPSAIDVFTLNENLYARFALDYPLPGPDDEYATEVHRRYSYTWDLIGRGLERAGYKTQAARAFLHAKKLAPQP
jgi:hypothetical protein